MHSFQPEPRHRGGRTALAADMDSVPSQERGDSIPHVHMGCRQAVGPSVLPRLWG